MGAVNLRHPGPGEGERRVIFKVALPHSPFPQLSLSFTVLSFLQEKLSGLLPCLLWSALTCSQSVWKVYENNQKEIIKRKHFSQTQYNGLIVY